MYTFTKKMKQSALSLLGAAVLALNMQAAPSQVPGMLRPMSKVVPTKSNIAYVFDQQRENELWHTPVNARHDMSPGEYRAMSKPVRADLQSPAHTPVYIPALDDIVAADAQQVTKPTVVSTSSTARTKAVKRCVLPPRITINSTPYATSQYNNVVIESSRKTAGLNEYDVIIDEGMDLNIATQPGVRTFMPPRQNVAVYAAAKAGKIDENQLRALSVGQHVLAESLPIGTLLSDGSRENIITYNMQTEDKSSSHAFRVRCITPAPNATPQASTYIVAPTPTVVSAAPAVEATIEQAVRGERDSSFSMVLPKAASSTSLDSSASVDIPLFSKGAYSAPNAYFNESLDSNTFGVQKFRLFPNNGVLSGVNSSGGAATKMCPDVPVLSLNEQKPEPTQVFSLQQEVPVAISSTPDFFNAYTALLQDPLFSYNCAQISAHAAVYPQTSIFDIVNPFATGLSLFDGYVSRCLLPSTYVPKNESAGLQKQELFSLFGNAVDTYSFSVVDQMPEPTPVSLKDIAPEPMPVFTIDSLPPEPTRVLPISYLFAPEPEPVFSKVSEYHF